MSKNNSKLKFYALPQGISNGNVSAIIQDSRGFMWFRTANGLNKFEGYNYTIYEHTPNDTIGPEQKEIRLNDGSLIYLATNDYKGQNDDARKKKGETKFIKTILETALLDLEHQHAIFNRTLEKQMKDTSQRDDILVGVRG